MDHCDSERNYDVIKLKEFRNNPIGSPSSQRFGEYNCARITKVALIASIVVTLLLILILQSVAIYQLKSVPTVVHVCQETTTSTTTTATNVTTSALTGRMACTCDYNDTTKQLETIASLINNISVNKGCMPNVTDTIKEIKNSLQEQIEGSKAVAITTKENMIATEAVVNDVLLGVEELLKLHNNSQIEHFKSCQDVMRHSHFGSISGYYHINSQLMYCEMGELCNSTGGWTRLAYLDMSDSTVDCPTGFRLYTRNGIRACGRPDGGASCTSVKFPSNGISYSQVCGRVVGYQRGSPDGLNNEPNDINSYYLDGISITQSHSRKHVWSLMCGLYDSKSSEYNCQCNNNAQSLHPFIGDHYFCESGNPSVDWRSLQLYIDDPLWDGEGCGSEEEACCTAPGLPWFHRSLDTSTDYLELRVCGDEDSSTNEDVPVSFFELYVK